MPLFHWTKQYAVHLPEIDAEHRAIFMAGAELERAAAAHAPKSRLREMIRALVNHAEDHFAHEERMMREVRYAAFDWHKKQHDGVRRRLKQFGKRIEANDREAPGEMLEYLAHWLHGHTAITDRMMGARLRNFHREHKRIS
ncbi:MAG TPA: hemerythrin family protein [Bryobacteraceae bacterium]|nr:hemerythrin family protein [Bryobacteraceae bacterium]